MSSRWEEIARSIHTAIDNGTLLPGDRLLSETELAAQWDVCRMTAHRAMDALQQQGLVVRRRRLGTVVAEKRPLSPKVVALLFFHANDFPQVDYIQGIRAGLPDTYDLLFCDTRNDPAREADYLRRMQTQADAIICYPTCDPANTDILQRITSAGKPLICVDRIPEGLSADAIVTDNFGSTHAALQSLQQQGHRNIAFFGYREMEVSSARERYEAYLKALAADGLSDLNRWTRFLPKGMGYDLAHLMQTIHEALFTLLHQPGPPTAVFCEDDYIMASILEACERQALSIPRDLAVLSFNDCPIFIPRLTRGVDRLVQQAQPIGRMAAARLQQRVIGEHLPPSVLRVPALFHAAAAGHSPSPFLPEPVWSKK